MKIRLLLVLIFTIAICFSCKEVERKDRIKEGYIEYNIEYLDDSMDSFMVGLLPKKMTIKFKNNNTINKIEGFSGIVSFTHIQDYKEKQNITLVKILNKKWEFKEEVKADGGWRRVVPSPKPISIMNEKTIEKLAREGNIVVAVGGGGVPVYIDEKNDVRPAEAVIDKDAATSLLGARIKADEFYVLTDVPYVYINFKKENEEKKEFLSVADAEKYMEEGQFAKGSMGPKIQAGIDFVKNGGKKSVITESTKLEDRKYGTKITMKYED